MLSCTGRICNKISQHAFKPASHERLTRIQGHLHQQLRNCSANVDNSNDEVLLQSIGNKCVITLNRPKTLNALTLSMIRKITPQLHDWEAGHKVMIIIQGVGGKAFCAGGDVRSIIESTKETANTLAEDFFREEYKLNYLISTLETPYIALIDGITMGGGVGLSIHGSYRVSTDKTLFAMPETAIGFVPDVGGTYFLPRLKGKLGLFLALTGYRLKGADVYHAGISTHATSHQDIGKLRDELMSLKINSEYTEIDNCLTQYTKGAEFLQQPFSLEDKMPLIDDCFSAPTVEGIITNLEASNDSFAKDTLALLRKMSPLSLKITKKALEEGSEQTLAECLQMEYRLTQRFVRDNDFPEGVRALLVDKDLKPKWKPASLEQCSAERVQSYFEPIENELKL